MLHESRAHREPLTPVHQVFRELRVTLHLNPTTTHFGGQEFIVWQVTQSLVEVASRPDLDSIAKPNVVHNGVHVIDARVSSNVFVASCSLPFSLGID